MNYKRVIWLAILEILGLVIASAVCAQTVSPLSSEFGKLKGKGTITTTNNALVPQVITVKPYSFQMKDGRPIYRDLDPTVHVQLSESSSKVPPRSSHTFDYSISCDRDPCAVAFVNVFSGQHVTEGLKLEFRIPFTVYVCTKEKDCRKRIHDAWDAEGQ